MWVCLHESSKWFDFIDTYVNVRMLICVFVSLGYVSNAQGC